MFCTHLLEAHLILLITYELNPHNAEYPQTTRIRIVDSVFSGKKYFLRRLSPGESLMKLLLPREPSIESWHGVQRQIARFCVMNLRNSGQASRAIYALNRIIFHHGLFAPDSIIGSLIYHHQTPDSMTSPHHFPDSTNRIGFSCSLLISHLPVTHLLMFTGPDRESHR